MAKKSKSVVFTNATIDIENDEILELKKDSENLFSLSAVLKDWDGVPGITISFKQDSEATYDAPEGAESSGF